MSASSKVMRLGKLCVLCQRQTYHRTRVFYSDKARRISLATAAVQDDEVRERAPVSRPDPKPFPAEIKLEPWVAAEFENNVMKGRKHPGRFGGKTSQLPSSLEEAANVLLENKSSNYKLLKQQAEVLRLFISTRVAPKEKQELKQRVEKIYNRLSQIELEKLQSKEHSLGEQELEVLQSRLETRAITEAHTAGFTWKPLPIVTVNHGLVYMIARLAQNYSVLLQIFNELKLRDPSFVPGTVYNFGSGLGSAVWAGNSIWSKDIFEYYCVDISSHMNTLARQLLQGGTEDAMMCIPGVYFRQFQSSDKTQYKLVVCAYSLLEMSDKKERLELITKLWNKTETYLVLVEVGNVAGHKLIQEARDHILKKRRKDTDSAEDTDGHVFAPCPHDTVCPKTQFHKNYCQFQSCYKPLHIGSGSRKEDKQTEKYSYIVLKKGPRLQEDTQPRVTSEVLKRPRHVYCHMCCPDGSLQHSVVSKNASRYSKYLYKCVRGSQWGDKLPVTWPVTWSSQQVEESPERSMEELSESRHSLETKENRALSRTDYQLNHSDFDSEDNQRFSKGQGCLNSEEPVQTDHSRQFT